MELSNRFDSVLYCVPERIRGHLKNINLEIKNQTEEIRLRAGLPISLTVKGKPFFVLKNGRITEYICDDILYVQKEELEKCFMLICNNSVYAHEAELSNGYVTINSGHRVGICGTFSSDGRLHKVTSLNIRISKEIIGCADKLVKEFDGGGFLIAGPPGCGKTTMLRDMIRQLSSGKTGEYYRIAVIDCRGEISGSMNGVGVNRLGENSDVIHMHNKALGTQIAVRTMFPDIIAFDEIGTAAELKSVSESFNSGVSVITTAHIGKESDLIRRSVTNGLINSGAVSKIAVLSKTIGIPPKIIDAEELYCEMDD